MNINDNNNYKNNNIIYIKPDSDLVSSIYNIVMQEVQKPDCVFQENENSSTKNSVSNANLNMQITGLFIEKSDSTKIDTNISTENKLDSISTNLSNPQITEPLDELILECKSLKNISKSINIKDMKNEAKKALLAALKWAENNNYDIRITSAYRDVAKQRILCKKTPKIGDTPEHSMHCKGLAFDIGIYPKGSLQKIRTPKIYLNLAKFLRQEGFDIYNGREFPDSPKDGTEWWHFQIGKNDGYLFGRSGKSRNK